MSHHHFLAYALVVTASLAVSMFQPVDIPQNAPQGGVDQLQLASLGLIR